MLRVAQTLTRIVDRRVLDTRLARLHARGYLPVIPNRAQLFAGSVDMVRFWIAPAADDYYRSQGIGFRLHQVLRVLDEPAAMVDPVGFFTTRDGIIGHVLQVVHANPVYDFQLLEMFDDGLSEMERQTETMIAGTHPRARQIGAIVEEPDYHERLLAFVRAWRKDPSTPPLLRANVVSSETWSERERTFGTLPAAMAYFATLPDTWAGALRHVRTVRTFTPRT